MRRIAWHRLWAPLAILLSLLLLAARLAEPTLGLDIAPGQIQPFGDLPYTAQISAPFPYVIHGDDLRRSDRSGLVLYENGTRLGPAHAHHDRIRDVGRGAYSHWGRGLIFSSSDNSDPRTNGRRYRIEAPVELNRLVLWSALLMTAAAGAMVLHHWWRRNSAVWLACAAAGARQLHDESHRGFAVALVSAAGAAAVLRHRWRHPRSGIWPAYAQAWAWLDRPLAAGLAHRLRISPLVLGLGLAAMAMIAGVATFGAFERSAWLLMTAPDPSHSVNSLLAFSSISPKGPVHTESVPFFSQLLMFSGGPIPSDFYAFYALRPVYAYVASAFVPVLGWFSALAFTNLIGWVAGIVLVYAFALKATGERSAAFWACLFSIGGMGFVSHVHDYSAHLLAFTFYFAAVYLVYASEVWRAPQPWRVHAGLGSFLALASLEYHTGLVALLGYALVSARHNRLIRIATVCAFVYGCTALWPHMLNGLAGTDTDFGAMERTFLKSAVDLWLSLSAYPSLLLQAYRTVVVSLLSFEAPLLVAFGAAGLAVFVVARRSLDTAIFVAAFFPVPVLALAAYTGPGMVSKGYLTYQTSILVYSGAGYLLHRLAGLGRRGPLIAGVTGTVVLAAALTWNLAFLFGAVGPLKTYFLGIMTYWAGLAENPSQIAHVPLAVSLTGAEPTPRLFFGNATLSDAGLVPCAAEMQTVTAPGNAVLRALVVRAPFVLLTAGAALTLLCAGMLRAGGRPLRPTRPAVWLAGGLVIAVGASPLLNYALRSHEFPVFCKHKLEIGGRHLRLEVDVSPAFVERLRALPEDVKELEILDGYRNAVSVDTAARVALVGDGLRIELPNNYWPPTVDRDALVAALKRTPHLALEVTHPSALPVNGTTGWQRNGLPGRRLIVDGRVLDASEQPVLPPLEIRARKPGNVFLPELIGF